MAVFYDASKSVFYINNSTGSSENITSYITSMDGLPGKRDLVDVTTFGSLGHRWGPSLENVEFTIEVLYSEDATVGTDTVFRSMRTATTTRSFSYYPAASTAGKIEGSAWCDDYNITSRVGSYVVAKIHCKADNNVTS